MRSKTMLLSELALAKAWGEAGRVMYPDAARAMKAKSKPAVGLREIDKQALEKVYSREFLDKIKVHWESKPLNEIGNGEFKVRIGDEYADYQTFGYHIYVRHPESMPQRQKLRKLIHELKHAEQFEKQGGSLADFGEAYFKAYFRAGQRYSKNEFEIEAADLESEKVSEVMSEWRSLDAKRDEQAE